MAIAAVLAAAAGGAPARAADPDLGGEWHLDTILTNNNQPITPDSSGRGEDLNVAAVSVVGGRFGNAFELDGQNSDLRRGPTAALEPQLLTVMAWVKTTNPGGTFRYLVGQGATAACSTASYGLSSDANGGVGFYVYNGTAALHSPLAAPGIWDGAWHAIAGTYDGTAVRLYVDGQQIGGGTPANGSIDYGLTQENFTVGTLDTPCGSGNGHFNGEIDEVRVYDRALTSDEIHQLQTAPGPDPPELGGGGGGGAGGGGGGGGGGARQIPVPRFTIGTRAALPHALSFNAATTTVASGAFVRDYAWDTDGNGTYDWDCGRSPVFAEGFRSTAGLHTIGLRVTDSLGTSAQTRLRVDVPAGAANGVRPSQNVVDCENPAAGNQADRADCVKSFGFGIVDVNSRGATDDCFSLVARRRTGSLLSRAASDPVGRTIEYHYRATLHGSLALNGLYVPLPESATSEFDSGDETIDVGHVEVGLGPFTTKPLDLRRQQVTPKKGVYHIGDVVLAGANAALGGLPVKGQVAIDLLDRASRTTVSVGLPKPFSLDPTSGKGTQGSVSFRSDNVNGVSFDGVKVKFDAYLGALTLRNAQLAYSKSKDTWSGGADIYLPGSEAGLSPVGVNAAPPPPDLGFGLRGGAFDHAGIGLNFLGAARPALFPGVFLSNIHVAFGVGPFRLTGGLGVAVGDVVDIDGDVFVAFASPSQPYEFPDADAAGDLAPLAGRTFDSFAIAVGGSASLSLPVVGKVPLAHAYGLYEYPDFFEAGAGFSLNMVLVKIVGDLHGFVLPSEGKFSFDAQVNACPDFHVDLPVLGDTTIDKPCFGAGAAISTVGAGICGTVPIPFVTGAIPVTVTVGYKWSGSVDIALFSCDLGPYEEANPRGARAAQAGAGSSFALPSGLPSAMVRVRGDGGAPDVTLAGPGGRSISTAEPPADPNVIVIRQGNETLIALKRPAGGTWRVAQSAASPRVIDVASARGLPAPHVVAHVTGRGRKRTLTYHVRPEPRQRVTFAERGPRTFRILGVAHGSRGSLRFTPADGRAGRRDIVARVTESGIDRPSLVVAGYSAPPPGPARKRGLRVTHRGSILTVTWRRSSGAASYSVVVSTPDGRRTLRIVSRPRVRITGVPADAHGSVHVAAERPGARGRDRATARFRQSIRRRTTR